MKLAMFLIIIFSQISFANQRITSGTIQDFSKIAQQKKTELSAEQILLVYDFDNTLMAMNRDLGSDQWYTWQAGLIKKGGSKEAVAISNSELFKLQYKIFALGKMHAVEAETFAVVKQLQDLKIKSIILTSRGPNYRGDVEDELDSFSFKDSAIGPDGGYPSTFLLPGLERPVSYMDGVMMGSGQHKGKVLRALLKKTGATFKSIIFMDDTLKNIENVEDEFKDGPELISFYYTHEQGRVQRFERDQSQAKKDWKKLAPVLQNP